MDRLDNLITIDIYQKLSDKLKKQQCEKLKEIEKIKNNIINCNDNNQINRILITDNILKEYFSNLKNNSREFIIKIVEKIEIHKDKTIDLYFKLEKT